MSTNLGPIKLPEAIENRVLSFLIPENPNSIKDWTLSSYRDLIHFSQISRNHKDLAVVPQEIRKLLRQEGESIKTKVSIWRKEQSPNYLREITDKDLLIYVKFGLEFIFSLTDFFIAIYGPLNSQAKRGNDWLEAIILTSLLSMLGTIYVPLRTHHNFLRNFPNYYTSALGPYPPERHLAAMLNTTQQTLGIQLGLLTNHPSLGLVDSLDEAEKSAINAWKYQKISGPLEKRKLWTSVSLLGIGISLIYLGRFNPDSPGWENLIEMILGTLILACYPKYNLLKILWKLTDQPLSPLPLRDFVLPPERAPELSAFFESKGLNLDSLPPPGFALAFAPQEQAPIEVVVDENTPLLTGHGTTI